MLCGGCIETVQLCVHCRRVDGDPRLFRADDWTDEMFRRQFERRHQHRETQLLYNEPLQRCLFTTRYRSR